MTGPGPAEMPEGGEGGTPSPAPSPWFWGWWHNPPPAELPPFLEQITSPVLNEILKLRDRVQTLENEAMLRSLRIRPRPGGGGPAELPPAPEFVQARFHWPGLHELPRVSEFSQRVPIPHEIAEFPVPDFVAQALAQLIDERMAAFSESILAEVRALQAQIKDLQGPATRK